MRTVFALTLAALLAPFAGRAAPAETDTVTIGPWQVQASYRGSTFDRCVMSRVTDDGVETRFVRDVDGLSLAMTSPRWRLERGKSYPVELSAGSSKLDVDMSASSDSVTALIKDDRFVKSLKLADALDVKGAGATIRVALDRSADGFQRLESCFEKNGTAVETNPFVAPPRSP